MVVHTKVFRSSQAEGRVKGKFVSHWSQWRKNKAHKQLISPHRNWENHLWSYLLDMIFMVNLSWPISIFVFYKNYSTEMLLFSSSSSSSPSSSSSGWPLSQPVPMMKCKYLPSVRWITFWLSARKCCYVLTKSVICWGFLITICLFALKGICQLLLLKPQGMAGRWRRNLPAISSSWCPKGGLTGMENCCPSLPFHPTTCTCD